MKLKVLALILVSSISAFASSESNLTTKKSDQSVVLPLTKGNMQIGGGFSHTSFNNEYESMSISPSMEYFVIDDLSLGGTLSYSKFGAYRYYGLGPSITYYFHKANSTAFYLSQGFSFEKGEEDSSNYSTGISKVGAAMFLTSSSAFSVELSRRYSVKDSDRESNYANQLSGKFSFFY